MYEHDVYLNMSALAYCHAYHIDHEELVNKVYEIINYNRENNNEEEAKRGSILVAKKGMFWIFDFKVVETNEGKNRLLISKSMGVK